MGVQSVRGWTVGCRDQSARDAPQLGCALLSWYWAHAHAAHDLVVQVLGPLTCTYEGLEGHLLPQWSLATDLVYCMHWLNLYLVCPDRWMSGDGLHSQQPLYSVVGEVQDFVQVICPWDCSVVTSWGLVDCSVSWQLQCWPPQDAKER